ncbi:MAG: hypothetical protein JOY54_04665 [Acidobacteriaceae bacterium]|nr:hypothetical protein [Acidobacteriaceae bacterium]
MRSKFDFARTVAGLVLFSIAFGYVEGAVVVYLRSVYLPLRMHFYPGALTSEVFPLLSLDQLRALGPENTLLLSIEYARELATLLMLAGVATVAARNVRHGVAAFLFCFGIWDVVFYFSLKLLLDWPASLFAWDILFLVPVPWVGPVLAPMLVSISMIAAGLLVLWREHNNDPVHINAMRWSLIILGGTVIVAAFVWDFHNTLKGAAPATFHWEVFALGEAIGLLAFTAALRRSAAA